MESQNSNMWDKIEGQYRAYKHFGSEYDSLYATQEAQESSKNSISGTFVAMASSLVLTVVLAVLMHQGLGGFLIAGFAILTILPIIGLIMIGSLFRKSPKETQSNTGNLLTNPLPGWVGKTLMAFLAFIFLYPIIYIMFILGR